MTVAEALTTLYSISIDAMVAIWSGIPRDGGVVFFKGG